jgi:hypothetical protein
MALCLNAAFNLRIFASTEREWKQRSLTFAEYGIKLFSRPQELILEIAETGGRYEWAVIAVIAGSNSHDVLRSVINCVCMRGNCYQLLSGSLWWC